MRIAVIMRPDAAVAEATNWAGEATVVPAAGELTTTPLPDVVLPLLLPLPTLICMERLKTAPDEFHA
jgi:hypothetical protein